MSAADQASAMQDAPPAASSLQMIRAMGGIGFFCAVLIVMTYELTLPTINRNKAEALQQAVYQVLPGATQQSAFVVTADGVVPKNADQPGGPVVYAGYTASDSLVGIAIEASGQGFQDVIKILYGYSAGRSAVIGIKVLESKETPGLGDKIEKDAQFLKNFEALDVSLAPDATKLKNRIVMVKQGEKTDPWQIDAITGATISSKAIANILDRSSDEMLPAIWRSIDAFKQAKQ